MQLDRFKRKERKKQHFHVCAYIYATDAGNNRCAQNVGASCDRARAFGMSVARQICELVPYLPGMQRAYENKHWKSRMLPYKLVVPNVCWAFAAMPTVCQPVLFACTPLAESQPPHCSSQARAYMMKIHKIREFFLEKEYKSRSKTFLAVKV
jgi:hypothetical protein